MQYLPIIIFCYKRPAHTQKVIDALKKNPEASQSDVYVFIDGPKTPQDAEAVRLTAAVVKAISGFESVTVSQSLHNKGLSNSIIDGVTSVLKKYGKAIILEDDIVVQNTFLNYMNAAVEKYIDNEKVSSIHGYVYPLENADDLPETFFIRGADCWGWATWKRAWEKFNPSAQELLNDIIQKHQAREFDFDFSYPYTKMLQDQCAGKIDSWAIRWHASAFLNGMMTLYPRQSQVENIGFDGSGTHCDDSQGLQVRVGVSNTVTSFPKNVMENAQAINKFKTYFKQFFTQKFSQNTRHYCTLFDATFMSMGRVLHQTLIKQSKEAHLIVCAFDDEAYRTIIAESWERTSVIHITEVEQAYSEFFATKSSRSIGEYCWTSTPHIIGYCLDILGLNQVTYLDSDLCFFSDPQILLDEMPSDKDVLITEHWYTKEYDQTEVSGRFCVQFIVFKNTQSGQAVLKWWQDKCVEWCYATPEPGRFGDQKYLDEWPTIFEKEVHILNNRGGGVAPWNIQQYKVILHKNKLWIRHIKEQRNYRLVFYHFHDFKHKDGTLIYKKDYKIRAIQFFHIHKNYIYKWKKYNSINTEILNIPKESFKDYLCNRLYFLTQYFL